MANDPKPLPGWVLHEFQRAAEANAKDLIKDAEILLERERWPRAFALAVLAWEEFGKGLMAVALAMADERVVTPARMRELRGDHIRKLMSAYEHQAMTGPPERWDDIESSQKSARSANLDKQRGLYVDLTGDGTIRQPSEISEDEARALVGHVRKVVYATGLRSVPFWLPPLIEGEGDDA